MSTPIRVGILTVSDRSSKGLRPDASGPALKNRVEMLGWQAADMSIVPDEREAIASYLTRHSDENTVDILLTTGGTGFAPRDITPEATQSVIERYAPGIAETIRAESLKITAHAMLSRGIAGVRNRTLIINLSGSPRAAVEQFDIIAPVLPHAVSLLQEDTDAEAGHREV